MVFIILIVYWYDELYCRVRWDDQYSPWFNLLAGVRQGGILSPDFYCLYVDELVKILSELNVGCYIKHVFVNALMYADDMALISPSLRGLQKLLHSCESYCNEWDICLNPKKSRNLYYGKRRSHLCTLRLNGKVRCTRKAEFGRIIDGGSLGAVLHVYNGKIASEGLGESPREYKNATKLTY